MLDDRPSIPLGRRLHSLFLSRPNLGRPHMKCDSTKSAMAAMAPRTVTTVAARENQNQLRSLTFLNFALRLAFRCCACVSAETKLISVGCSCIHRMSARPPSSAFDVLGRICMLEV